MNNNSYSAYFDNKQAEQPAVNILFSQYFRETMMPVLGPLEETRLGVLARRKQWGRGFLVVMGIAALVLLALGYYVQISLVALAALIGYFVITLRGNKVEQDYKLQAVPLLLRYVFGESATYQVSAGSICDRLWESGMWEHKVDSHRETDLIQVKTGAVQWEACEVVAERMTREEGKRKSDAFFKGFVMKIEFNKEFNGTVALGFQPTNLAVPKASNMPFTLVGTAIGMALNPEKALQNLTKQAGTAAVNYAKEKAFGKDLDLDNEEFNQRFRVTASDRQLAHYLLTPLFMEKILDLDRAWRQCLRFCFQDGWLFIAFPTGQDLFEGSVSEPMTDESRWTKEAEKLMRWPSILDRLDLHNRLWSRE